MTDEAPRWLAYMRLEELAGDERNPKGHDLDSLRQSYGRFGFTEPIVVDERTGKLVSGHGRLELLLAERSAGSDPPEGVVAVDDAWTVPVMRGWRSADDAEAGAYIIAANRLTERGGWKPDALATLLEEVATSERGLDGVGYSPAEFDDLMQTLGSPPDLDALAEQHGPPDASDFWPTLRFKVSPELKARYEQLVGHLGGNDSEHFAFLVQRAEAAPKARK